MAVTYVDAGYVGSAKRRREPRRLEPRVPRIEPRRLPRSKRRPLRLVLASLMTILWVQALGQFTIWMLADPQYDLGHSVFEHKTAVLKFEVAGHKYEIRSPNVPLTQEETSAYWYYVSSKHFPVYAADGPMAVDP